MKLVFQLHEVIMLSTRKLSFSYLGNFPELLFLSLLFRKSKEGQTSISNDMNTL